jgi:hypothetical protein
MQPVRNCRNLVAHLKGEDCRAMVHGQECHRVQHIGGTFSIGSQCNLFLDPDHPTLEWRKEA